MHLGCFSGYIFICVMNESSYFIEVKDIRTRI